MTANVVKLGPRTLHLRQRRTCPGHRQHERNGVCLPGVVAASHLAAGGCTGVPQGFHRVDYSISDFDYKYAYDSVFSEER